MNSSLPAIRRWLEQLAEDVDHNRLTQPRREEILGQLKFLGRDANVVKALFDESGMKILGHYAFGDYPRTTSREALRCLANSLLLVPATQETFATLGYTPKAAEGYKLQDNLDEFIYARLLFLMTYTKTTNILNLIEEHDLATSLVTHIKRHADTPPLVPKTDIDAVLAISESLKLLFNITNAVPQHAQFNAAAPYILTMLIRTPLPAPPLQAYHLYMVNGLANLELRDNPSDDLHPDITTHLSPAIDKLLSSLEQSLKAYNPSELDTQLIPLLTVLRKINEAADSTFRLKLQTSLLPRDTERDLPLGQSPTLASRLLKMTTTAGLIHLPEVISALLFELSDKDPNTFVKNIGYGYAAGYLMSHKIPVPESAKNSNSVTAEGQIPVNPVTGQRLDKEEVVNTPEMSQEEKEREAERLFILFERLRATGVVDVKNPVTQAREEGRFEEVNDSE